MRGLVIGFGLVGMVGCGLEPVPKVAVFGTTIAILVPAAFPVGFGRYIGENFDGDPNAAAADSYAGDPLEDPQRGELIFKAVSGPVEKYLPVRHITRVAIDESARGSTNPSAAFYFGQEIAFVDIPEEDELGGFTEGSYNVEVSLWRRVQGVPGFTEIVVPIQDQGTKDWVGWGTDDASIGIPLIIESRNAPGPLFTRLLAWAGAGNPLTYHQDIPIEEEDLRETIPDPHVVLNVSGPPAAWEMQLDYPSNKLEIKRVSARINHPSAAIVTMNPQPSLNTNCNDMGTLTVQVAAAEPIATKAEIAFELLDFAACGRASASDFNVTSMKSYNEDGILAAGASFSISGPD